MSKSIFSLIVALFFALQSKAAQPIFNVSSLADVSQGQIIDIDFHVDHFSQLVNVQFSVNWDPQILSFKAVKNLNPSVSGLSLSGSFNLTPAFTSQGKFSLAWTEPGVNQITIPDGSLFFTVEFEVVGDPCQSTPVAITDDPTPKEASEDGINDIGLVNHDGQVSIFGEGCVEDLTVTGNSVIGACGANSCVSFTVQNFIEIGAMDYTIVYDPAVIQFDEIKNYATLLGFGAGSTNLVSPGLINVVWTNINAQDESLPNGTVLFEACFDVIGTGGQSSEITFGPGHDPGGSFYHVDPDIIPVPYIIQPAQITAQCALEGFALITTDSVCTTPGGIVCIDISVNDFDEIIEVQGSINWDSTKFKFHHLEGYNLPALDDGSFGHVKNSAGVIDEGQLSIAWLDLTLNGVTRPDGAIIFRLCLEAVGPVGSSSAITFTDIPTELEFSNLDSVLDFTVIGGIAEIKQSCDDPPPCTIGYTISTTQPACPRESTGAIDLTVTLTNCTETPTYVWSLNNLPTQDLTGVPAGNYTVTITVGTQVVIANVTVSDPQPIGVTAIITDPTPPSPPNSDGAINITVTGGTPPYSFKWSNDAMTEDLTNITSGTYSVTVTDSKGCVFIPDNYIVGADLSASLTHVTCNGGSNGAINLNVSFGTSPYTFNWSPAGLPATQNLSNLSAGTYCVTVTDVTGSTRDSCFIIQANPINVTASITKDVNEDCHGAIDLNVTGGTPPISYIWSNGATTQDLINLCSDTFCVTITYSGICSVDTCFIIRAGGISVSLSAHQYGGGFETSCEGTCDGSINSTVQGGATPYSYHWNNGFTTANLSGLCAGTYTLTVTDASGETAVSSITLVSPPEIQISFLTTLPSDPSTNDGAISAVVTGGVPNITYNWSTNAGNTASLSNLFQGVYSLTVTDANQCTAVSTIDLFTGDVPCFKGLRIITPNDDGKNDVFIITCIFSADNHLSIYNRNGGLVYETNNYENNWTGVDEDNQPIADGGYLWVLEIFQTNNPPQLLKGTVNVLRTAD
ncbi:MAG TPA: gliding motility-associated C-terminal domain-containing protein [Saprospiraceae bacterium]|nr:gliding motility-associated C-terminal domain-containing protein [Saprospiraceae bacterium]